MGVQRWHGHSLEEVLEPFFEVLQLRENVLSDVVTFSFWIDLLVCFKTRMRKLSALLRKLITGGDELCIELRMADPEGKKDREKVLLRNSMIFVEMVKVVIDCLTDGIGRYRSEFVFGGVMVDEDARENRRAKAPALILCFCICDKFSRTVLEIAFEFSVHQ
jgi:hypothetical protein